MDKNDNILRKQTNHDSVNGTIYTFLFSHYVKILAIGVHLHASSQCEIPLPKVLLLYQLIRDGNNLVLFTLIVHYLRFPIANIFMFMFVFEFEF